MLAPAAVAYAVLPVGVEIIKPSPCKIQHKISAQEWKREWSSE